MTPNFDNCILHHVISAAASMPNYVSPVDRLNQHLANLPAEFVQEYCTRCESILKSRSFTVEQLQGMYINTVLPMLNNTNTAEDFGRELLALVGTLN